MDLRLKGRRVTILPVGSDGHRTSSAPSNRLVRPVNCLSTVSNSQYPLLPRLLKPACSPPPPQVHLWVRVSSWHLL